MTALPRLLLAAAYLVLAHLAGTRASPALAAVALADLAVLLLLEPLLRPRAWAWALFAALVAGFVALSHSTHALLPLLLVPVLFTALVSWWFARTLRDGRVPLVGRIVSALYARPYPQLEPDLRRYTLVLTRAWALLLALLAAANLVLALLAVPNGVLAQFGVVPPVQVTERQWSLFANVLNYGIVGGFFLAEYQWRKRRFPQRPYRDFPEFVRRMAGLGPRFWRDLFR